METIKLNITEATAKETILSQRRSFDHLERKWIRFDSKQAEYATECRNEHGGSAVVLFKSYDTIVGFAFCGVFYELGKYSPTTSKQITQFCNRFGYERVLVKGSDFDNYWERETYPPTKSRWY